jgi:mannose-6-phosphate isomerase-like protein (cupin superfamily)
MTGRREFLQAGAAAFALSLANQLASAKGDHVMTQAVVQVVLAANDRTGQHHAMGSAHVDYKMGATDAAGGLFVVENVLPEKGGPPRHVHNDQDEWFYAVEGDYIFEIGTTRFTLRPGDAVLGPRNVPHVWAHSSTGNGRLLSVFAPAGKMDGFFQELAEASKTGKLPLSAAAWHAHGMEILGPPLSV